MDISRADLGLLLTLDVLLTELSVTKAAKRLGVSQPALSGQLARLRVLFGDPLLVQAGRILVPTKKAESIAGPLHLHINQVIGLVHETQVFRPQESERTFVIATTDYAHHMIVPAIIGAVEGAGPGLVLVFMPVSEETIAEHVQSGQVDLVIASNIVTPDTLKAIPLLRDRHVLMQRQGHPRGSQPSGLEEFCTLRHVGVAMSGRAHGLIDAQLAQLGRRRSLIATVPTYSALPQLLAHSDLVAALPRKVAETFVGAFECTPLPFAPPPLTYLLAWHERNHSDVGSRWLRETIVGCLPPEITRDPQ